MQEQIMSDQLARVVLQMNEFSPQISGPQQGSALAPSIPAWQTTKTATHGYWCRLMAKEPPLMDSSTGPKTVSVRQVVLGRHINL